MAAESRLLIAVVAATALLSSTLAYTLQVADTTAPRVSVTAPALDAHLLGTVTVAASASDESGVAAVQFVLNGVPLGDEDTVAPFSVTWDTAAAVVGSHMLSARARDAAGNMGDSELWPVVVVRSIVAVPDVVGETESAATMAIANAGLIVGPIATANSDTIAAGSIISQNPAAGTGVAPGSAVALVRSLGPVNVIVPDVVGQTEASATTEITNAGLTVGAITTVSSDTVAAGSIISQNPLAGASVALGSAVALVRSSGPEQPAGDNVAPVAVAPAATINLSVMGTSVPIRVAWSASDEDGGSGLARYEVQRSTNNGGTWSTLSLRSALQTSETYLLTPGTTYMYRVRAVDLAGNVGAYATSAPFTPRVTQDNAAAVTYAGTWSTETATNAAGGTRRFASAAGATATFTFTGNNIAWAAVRANDRGRAEVVIDGVSAGIVDLWQSSTTPSVRRLMFQRNFATSGTHTIQVRVLGTKTTNSLGTRVDVDAFVTTETSAPTTGISVPNVVGMTEAAAQSAITAADLTVGLITTDNSATVPTGTIISQDPPAGALVQQGSQVALVRSLGPATTTATVPNVVGETEANARTAITNAGFMVGAITAEASATVPSGSIISQTPVAGTTAATGSAIALVQSTGPATTTDTVGPVTVAPSASPNLSVMGSNVPIRIAWSATDNTGGSGVARYELQRSTNNGGSWTTLSLRSALQTNETYLLTPGTTYVFRARAIDVAGNAGAYATGVAFTPRVTQNNATAVTYAGTWAAETVTSASGGSQHFSSTAGATATFTFTGRSVAWAAVRANNRGRAEVFIDGVSAGVIDLYQSSTTPSMRRLMFQRTFATSGTHTIQIRVLGTRSGASAGTRVDVDAFVITQ